MNKRRMLLALVIAPLIPVVAVILLPALLGQQIFGNWLPFAILFGLVTSYLGAIAFGVPLISLLRKFGRLNIISVSLVGAASGSVVLCLSMNLFGFMLGSQPSVNLATLVWGAGLGLTVAIPFCLIAGITSHSSSLRP
ncbi:hypothetical protein ACJO2E_18655 [Marinobacter sp. M1N3S26]|uniref:hypothetical protein n=1 Tax=Marinobacter sp. M1N3S26 TaxID=3382299 RepID=UPI00387B06FD